MMAVAKKAQRTYAPLTDVDQLALMQSQLPK